MWRRGMAPFGGMLVFGVLALAPLVGDPSAADLTIVEKGRSEYKIVIPLDHSAGIDYAAGELQKYLQEISGVRLR